jgi:replicative DNA helicase
MSADLRRLPTLPHSLEAEEAVVGALLIDAAAWDRIGGLLTGSDFFDRRHELIFAAVAAVRGAGRGVDFVTVAEQLQRQEQLDLAGGMAYLGTLARDTPTSANAATYADIVRERAGLRRLRKCGADLIRAIDDAGGRSASELTAAVQERLLQLQARLRPGRGLVDAPVLVSELVDDLDRRSQGHRGLAVGLADFDALTCGLEPGDLVVIAGRPGMGKTALLVSLAAHVGRSRGVAIFSAEMPSRQLMRRCLALIAGIPQGRLRHAEKLTDSDWATIASGASELATRRVWIDDTSQPAMTHVRAEVTGLKARTDLGLVLVDYVQLLTGRGRNRYEELRDVAYGLKAMAKDLGVPVIVLAQLNRDVESREGRRPNISDLRDSGAIEEAADIIGLLYAEGYYNPAFAMPYVLECAIAKNRNGERGECLWQFAGDRSLVEILDSGAAIQYRRIRADSRKSRGTSSEL